MKVKDTLRFLYKLSFKKLTNAGAVLTSYCYSRLLQAPHQSGLPITISIEPTTTCNLGCTECPSGLKSFTRPTGMLNFDLYKDTLDQLSDKLMYIYFYFQGEPFMHPQFVELVEYATEKKLYTVTSTNGHFLTERKAREIVQSGLDRIIVSIDGVTQQTYQQYRVGGSLEKAIAGIKNLVKARKELKAANPHIILQFLVMRHNEHEIEEVKKLGRLLKVDEVKIKTTQVYDFKNGHNLIPTLTEYTRYAKKADGSYHIKNNLLNHCWKLWHSCVITWDGRIVPCCFDKDASHQLGDVSKQTMAQIWQGPHYHAFRTQLLSSRAQIDICTNCSEGTKVWA